MNSKLITGPVPDLAVGVRQWFAFPTDLGPIRTSRLRSFRILLETKSGNVMFVALEAKTAPDEDMALTIAALLGDIDPYLDRVRASAVLDELGVHARVMNSPIDSENAWLPATVLAESFLDEALHRMAIGDQLRDANRLPFEEALRQKLRSGISGFVSNLDKLVVETARNAEDWLCRPSSYNYLRGSGTVGCVLRRNRMQAGTAFPFLLPLLPFDSRLERIRMAIDAGKPLIDILAWFFSVPKPVIRALRHQPGSSTGSQWALQPWSLTISLSDIPNHLRPQTPDAWSSFNATVALISKISGRPIDTTANRLWLRAAALQGYRVDDAVDGEVERSAHDIDDFSGFLTDALNFQLRTTTGLSNRMAVAAAVRSMITAHNPVRLVRIARRWREAYLREQGAFSAERQLWLGACWPPVIGGVFEIDSRRIVCLPNPEELTTEGRAMSNCVATYSGPCLEGSSQIFSIRDISGRHCSTLETTVVKDTLQFRIVQHKGHKNSAPSATCRAAAELLLKHLNRSWEETRAYMNWKKSIADRPTDERVLIALYKPILASLDATLPKQWSVERLLSIAKNVCNVGQPVFSNWSNADERSEGAQVNAPRLSGGTASAA
jgi:hypothetical protein